MKTVRAIKHTKTTIRPHPRAVLGALAVVILMLGLPIVEAIGGVIALIALLVICAIAMALLVIFTPRPQFRSGLLIALLGAAIALGAVYALFEILPGGLRDNMIKKVLLIIHTVLLIYVIALAFLAMRTPLKNLNRRSPQLFVGVMIVAYIFFFFVCGYLAVVGFRVFGRPHHLNPSTHRSIDLEIVAPE